MPFVVCVRRTKQMKMARREYRDGEGHEELLCHLAGTYVPGSLQRGPRATERLRFPPWDPSRMNGNFGAGADLVRLNTEGQE
jgi:hypothetical protein